MRNFSEVVFIIIFWVCISVPNIINFNRIRANQYNIIQKLNSIQQECINMQNNRTVIHCDCHNEHKTDTVTKYIYIK